MGKSGAKNSGSSIVELSCFQLEGMLKKGADFDRKKYS